MVFKRYSSLQSNLIRGTGQHRKKNYWGSFPLSESNFLRLIIFSQNEKFNRKFFFKQDRFYFRGPRGVVRWKTK